jgi:hypothetical protein
MAYPKGFTKYFFDHNILNVKTKSKDDCIQAEIYSIAKTIYRLTSYGKANLNADLKDIAKN